jgi:acetyl esterase/lipase
VDVTTVAYVSGPGADPVRHRLDVYRPTTGRDLPILLFAHGGVWQSGDKAHYHHVGEAFASRGIVTAVINYRLTPPARHPAHAHDVARATAWLARHGAQYGGRGDRIFLSGHSAGGHLVSLVLFDRGYLEKAGFDPDALAGVVPLSGIFDLTRPIDDTPEGGFARFVYPPFGEDREGLEAASPIRHLRATRVPLLVVLAGNDYQDMQRQSRDFVDAVKGHRIPVTFETVTGRDHFDLVHAIGRPDDRTTDVVAGFVR